MLVHPPTLLPPQADLPESGRRSRPYEDISEARKLATLLDVSQALGGHVSLAGALSAMLVTLARRCGAVRGAVSLLDDSSGELEIRASFGLSHSGERTRYHLGEGITGTVADSGEPIVVPEISRDPRFLYRAAGRKERGGAEFSFLCVPLQLSRRAVGTLSIELPYRREREFERLLKFLRVVASMLSQAVRIHRLLQAERQKLVTENAQLRQELRQRNHFSNMVGASAPIRQLYDEVGRVAGTNTTVLVRGESGTAKELIAQAIHDHSPRLKGPLMKVVC